MRTFHVAAAALALVLTGAATSAIAAECKGITAAGDGLTKDIATLMSSNGLKTIIESKGLKGQGEVKTVCTTGTFLVECKSSQMACK